ncbi:FDXHR family putative zinc-binding protein [Pseudonocardia tropica]|uniref:FDXHR family putative zinc-binding protein n=1 Tax=Pseudonocardia tropica TaxID=681289 RepID=UPI003CD078A5
MGHARSMPSAASSRRAGAASAGYGTVGVMTGLVALSCCGRSWVGPDRAHCCGRHGGCGQVFDDAALWDAHRSRGACRNPKELAELGLARTKNGIWIRQ